MKINVGYELIYDCPKPTPMILALNIHFSRVADILVPDHIMTDPAIPITAYRDDFGNWRSRIVAPKGQLRLFTDAVVRDSGKPDPVMTSAQQIPVQNLPEETLTYLLGSRYCDTDRLSQQAWDWFGRIQNGAERVKVICDFVHRHIRFDYLQARPTRTAGEALDEQVGVCRDYTHLAITLCRCLNIPARYCTGYLSDIGVPPPHGPGDFAAWLEVYLEGGWHIVDARNNKPCIGRILIARGRDASDVPITHTFGPNTLTSFRVWTDEITG